MQKGGDPQISQRNADFELYDRINRSNGMDGEKAEFGKHDRKLPKNQNEFIFV
jgi:hypothetical protein